MNLWSDTIRTTKKNKKKNCKFRPFDYIPIGDQMQFYIHYNNP